MTDDLARYRVTLLGDGSKCDEIRDAIDQDIRASGLDDWAVVEYVDEADDHAPSVVVACWTQGDDPDPIDAVVDAATDLGVLVLPVVDTTTTMPADLAGSLADLNAMGWDETGAAGIADACLRELGIHDRERRLFVSYRRSDGTLVAAQLHDALCGSGWNPFIDRLGIEGGDVVQEAINTALEDMAFLLLIETPEAEQSQWIDREVLYAKSNTMGILVVNVDGAEHVPMAGDLPRIVIGADDIERDGSQVILSDDAVDEILVAIERAHTAAMARRRRTLVLSTKASAEHGGAVVSHRPGWRLQVTHGPTSHLVSHLPRLPKVADIHDLDAALDHGDNGLLIHAAHRLPDDRKALLTWAVENRQLELIPGNAIGARWATP